MLAIIPRPGTAEAGVPPPPVQQIQNRCAPKITPATQSISTPTPPEVLSHDLSPFTECKTQAGKPVEILPDLPPTSQTLLVSEPKETPVSMLKVPKTYNYL